MGDLVLFSKVSGLFYHAYKQTAGDSLRVKKVLSMKDISAIDIYAIVRSLAMKALLFILSCLQTPILHQSMGIF